MKWCQKTNLQEPQRNRRFCQFYKDQYCTYLQRNEGKSCVFNVAYCHWPFKCGTFTIILLLMFLKFVVVYVTYALSNTGLVIIKLTKFAVALRLRCGSCKFIFWHYFIMFFLKRTLYIVWSQVRRRVTRRLTRHQTMCNVLKYRKIL